jgi:hypothetical protein
LPRRSRAPIDSCQLPVILSVLPKIDPRHGGVTDALENDCLRVEL